VRRLAVLLALLVTACGSSSPPPVGEARATVKRYFDALARGDAAGMCRELTEETREDAVKRAHAPSCAAAGGQVVTAVPDEMRERLHYASYGTARLDGDTARVEVVSDDMFAEKPDHVTVKLRASEGAWRISGLPWGRDTPDEVSTCAMRSIRSFERGDVGPSWKREGRETYDVFISRLCKRVHAAHVVADPFGQGGLSRSEAHKVEQLAIEVVEQMRSEGLLSTD
jgi:hypothetical protein